MTDSLQDAVGLPLREATDRWTDPELRERWHAASANYPKGLIVVGRLLDGLTPHDRERIARKREFEVCEDLLKQDLVDRLIRGELVATGYPEKLSPRPASRIEPHQWELSKSSLKFNFRMSEVELGRQLYVAVRVYRAGKLPAAAALPTVSGETLPRPARRTHLGRLVAEVADSIPKAASLKNGRNLSRGAIAEAIDLLMNDSRLSGESRTSVERELRRYRGLK